MLHALRNVCLLLLVIPTIRAEDVPCVEVNVEALRDNLRVVGMAWLDSPATFSKALELKDSLDIQQAVDGQVTILVTINPESRVKVQRGPGSARLQLGWQTPLLVKVINEAGVTASLEAKLNAPSSLTCRFFEWPSLFPKQTALTRKLSGRAVEYRALLFHSTTPGKLEATLSLEAGENTQDLGMRAELPLLLDTRIEGQPFYFNKANLLTSVDSNGTKGGIKTTDEWERRRLQIQARAQMVMGKLPVVDQHTSPAVQVIEEKKLDQLILRKIKYQTIDNDWVPAYLLIPSQRRGKLPAVVCLHQTTKTGKDEPVGLNGLPNLHYAKELAERGYVTLSPDYPGFGDYLGCNAYQQGYASATMKGIVNHQHGVTLLANMPEVDADRIGCMGHSLGGHNTLFAGLFDERIKAMATSCGFCSFEKYYQGNLTGWSHPGYMPRIASLYQRNPKLMPFEFNEVLAALAPRPVFINAPMNDANFHIDGVKDCVKSAKPVYELYGKVANLVVEHPECGHDFPKGVRERCYDFIDQHLKK